MPVHHDRRIRLLLQPELLLTVCQKRGAVNLALGRFPLAVDD